MAITLKDVVRRDPDIVTTELDQELVMFDFNTGKYFSLDPIARAIWQQLATPLAVTDLVERMRDTYDGPAETISTQVLAFLDRLDGLGLLRPPA